MVDETTEGPMMMPRIWDRRLNAAILTIAERLIPRGWNVVSAEEADAEAIWKSCEEGRPMVYDRPNSTSIFGDVEVDHAFQAVSEFCMYTPPAAHPHHRPNLCAQMMVSGLDRLMSELVTLYGDDELTQRWRKAHWTHTIGRLAFLALVGSIPGNNYDFVVSTLSTIDADGTLPVSEVRDNFIGMYARMEEMMHAIVGVASRAAAEKTDEAAQAAGVTFH